MTDHIAVLEKKLASSVALADADPELAPHLQPEIDAIRAAIALMRGQSEVQTLLAEYMREYDNPAPDYTYRHLLRERLFKVAKGPSR